MINQINYYYSKSKKMGVSDIQVRNIPWEFHTHGSKSVLEVTN